MIMTQASVSERLQIHPIPCHSPFRSDFSVHCPRLPGLCILGHVTMIYPLLAMCCKHRFLPLLPGQEGVWIFMTVTIPGSMSVTVAQLLKAREQITANLALNMADNCFLVMFNKSCFFHMKINRVKTQPVLWGSDFWVLRWNLNWTTEMFEACLQYFLPWISKWMC